MSFPANNTVLEISGDGITPYAARGLKQQLAWLSQASQVEYTINGVGVDLSLAQFQKFATTITGNDQKPPKMYKPGTEVTVKCISELSYKTVGGTPERTVVAGSSYTDGDFTFYRPQLTMIVVGLQTDTDEYGAVVGWTLTLTEK